ncbi:MAG TPA: type II CAAX endopeptidase family protein [Anaerolineales bacterium]|nr:type II CAAX endopeptidase family protein [Anaerolineales bacterium]
MSVLTNTLSADRGFSGFIRRHPLVSYFVLAYGIMWLAISPMVADALEIANIPDVLSLLSYILSSLLGPTVAAFWVTGVLEGKSGMRTLLRRTFQFRAGWQWYTVVLFVPLMIWFGAYSFLYNGAPLMGLVSNPSLLVSIFLPNVLIGLLIPSIGEEPGWRGFALPRLQKLYGPILGTLILGTLHGVWHLPALLTPMFDPFTITGFIEFVLTAIAASFLYTWVFNNTGGNVWIAIVLHSSGNAAVKLLSELIPQDVVLSGWLKVLDSGWINLIAFGMVAALLLIMTRGRLGYQPDQTK